MLGWNLSVHSQKRGGHSPATEDSPVASRLAVWQTAVDGLDWIIQFAREGKAIALGGNGYPNSYTVLAEYAIPVILDGPPLANDRWRFDVYDVILDNLEGKTVIDRDAAKECRFNEWLLIEAWDES